MRLIKSSKLMPLLSAVMLLQFACSTLPPSAMEPVNRTVKTGLSELVESPATDLSSGLFSFRIITPVENVDLFSILQYSAADQNTLPVDQLEQVILAKEKILNDAFIKPEEMNTIGFFISRYYSWDIELARQALIEVMDTYYVRRNAQWSDRREIAQQRALQLIEMNKVKQDEIDKQAEAIYDSFYDGVGQPQKITLEEQQKNRERAEAYSQRMIEKNKRAQDEHAKQAKAANDKLVARLEEDRKAANERAARYRKLLLSTTEGLAVKSLAADDSSSYTLYSLANGDFMIDARESLPALIQLQVKDFEQPILVPVMPQTRSGRLLISIDQDEQGRPVVYGGMDANTGLHFDLSQPVFSIKYAESGQVLEYVYPDGRLEQYPIDQLQNLSSEQALEQVQPETTQLDSALLGQKQVAFSDVHYQFTPELEYMYPDQALDVLATIQEKL